MTTKKNWFGILKNEYWTPTVQLLDCLPNFKRSDSCEASFRSDTTEHPLKMSGMVREGNRRGFLAIPYLLRFIFQDKLEFLHILRCNDLARNGKAYKSYLNDLERSSDHFALLVLFEHILK